MRTIPTGLGLSLLLCAGVASAVPPRFAVQGVIRDAQGSLQSEVAAVTVTIFDAQTNGHTIAGPYGPTTTMVTNGLFSFYVEEASLRSKVQGATDLWLEVTEGNNIYPRQRLVSEPFALVAASADSADALSSACVGCVSDANIAGVSGTKVTGKVASAVSADSASAFLGAFGGDVTGSQSATTVSGLLGRPINGAAPSDGQTLRYDATSGRWALVTVGQNGVGAGTVTQVNTGPGLDGGPITGSGTLSISTGGVTNAMLATPWVTIQTAGGLSGGGQVMLGGSLTLSSTAVASITAVSPLSVTSGTNPAISLSGVVSTPNGGTGLATAPTGAGQFLRSAAAGTWSIGAIAAADLPDLSPLYLTTNTMQTVTGAKAFSTASVSALQAGTLSVTSTISGSIDGNAGTVTNGVYTTGTYNDPTWLATLAGAKITGTVANAAQAASFTGMLAGDVTGGMYTTLVKGLNGTPVGGGAPVAGQALIFDGVKWAPGSASAGAGTVTWGTNQSLYLQLTTQTFGSAAKLQWTAPGSGYAHVRVEYNVSLVNKNGAGTYVNCVTLTQVATTPTAPSLTSAGIAGAQLPSTIQADATIAPYTVPGSVQIAIPVTSGTSYTFYLNGANGDSANSFCPSATWTNINFVVTYTPAGSQVLLAHP